MYHFTTFAGHNKPFRVRAFLQAKQSEAPGTARSGRSIWWCLGPGVSAPRHPGPSPQTAWHSGVRTMLRRRKMELFL